MDLSIFVGKTLLITGGTDTFGNAVVDMASKTGFGEIRIFSRDEKKQDDMRGRLKNSAVKFYIGDVRNYDSVLRAMHGVDFVFHAAALKQVPSCEFFPIEAVQTNTLGAENVMKAALAFNLSRVIVLSTDKAVYPVNAMGMSKALMEKCMVAKARMFGESSTVFCGTRYGNVMASRGSVVPLLLKQIQAGEPLTMTDPNMTRFMMTIEGAVDLVLYAFAHGAPGDIFVQKTPAAICRKVIEAKLTGKHEIGIWGCGHQTRSFMYIDDCINGIGLIMNSEILEPINLGSSEAVSINQSVDIVEDIAGIKLLRNYDLGAPTGLNSRNSDNTLIEKYLGWEPSISLRAGLEETYA
jgi:UDP-glucose 4-epimerase